MKNLLSKFGNLSNGKLEFNFERAKAMPGCIVDNLTN